jgi:hypothetical protein
MPTINLKEWDKPNEETNKIIRRIKNSCTIVLVVTHKDGSIETFSDCTTLTKAIK